ncbi:MAG: lactate racemase domain-containing protein [Peptococcaceae bacterium]|nr:lactate racemase domain-containing protein [Peptococcaceae bacterium]
MESIKLPQGAWFEEKEIELRFPDGWEIEVCGSPSDGMGPLSDAEIKKALASPVGTGTLAELAAGKKDICILFDDLSRGTRVYELVPHVLEELAGAGIRDDQIRFICALGNHGAHTMAEFAKKLGRETVARFPVFNHNPYENCQHLGQTSRGTPVAVNAEVMKCDLKIGIGCITPHPFNGFGGGGKILFPGVCSAETVLGNHVLSASALMGSGLNPVDGLGRFEGNIMREEMEEVCRMAGLDFIVNVLVNNRCETVDLVAGHPIGAHYAGVEKAKKIYGTRFVPDADVVVANANFKACEAFIAMLFAIKSLKPGGDAVVITHTPMGQIPHYLLGAFGKYIGGRLWNPNRGAMTAGLGRIIMFSPYRCRTDEDWFGGYGRVQWAAVWEDVIDLLKDRGPGTRVNVFTDGTIQYYLP